MTFHRSRFSMHGEEEYPGYTDGDLWNGWATPLFSGGTARKIVRLVNAQVDEIDIVYIPGLDAFVEHPLDEEGYAIGAPEDYPQIKGKTIRVGGRSIKVYPLGAYSWVWEERGVHY